MGMETKDLDTSIQYIKAYKLLSDINVIMALRVRAIPAYFFDSKRTASLISTIYTVAIVT